MDIQAIRIEPCKALWGGDDMGFTEGDMEIQLEESGVEVTSHQTGAMILDMLRTGKKVKGIKLVLKETSVERLTTLLKTGGDESTPTAEVTTIKVNGITAINSKYFDIYSALDAVKYRVWFNVNSTGVAPSSTGVTLVPVALDATPSVAEVVTAIQGALDALAGFVATESGTTVTVTCAATGGTSDPDAGTTTTAILDLAVVTQGIGTVPGWGESRNFSSMAADAKKLVLHPLGNSDTDMSSDFAFWKAYPRLNSIKKSGLNPQLTEVEFWVFLDQSRDEAVNLFCFGAHL